MAGESALKRVRQPTRQPPEDAQRRMIEAAQRDPRHFAELYEHTFERVYAFIVRRVGDRDQAQDLTADVYYDALKNLDRFEWRGVPFAAWLLRIAANAIADRGKHQERLETMQLHDLAGQEQSDPIQVEEIEHRVRLFKMLDELPADQRRVIAMRFAQEKSIAEIAQEIGRSEGAIKQLQFRGLQSLRKLVGER